MTKTSPPLAKRRGAGTLEWQLRPRIGERYLTCTPEGSANSGVAGPSEAGGEAAADQLHGRRRDDISDKFHGQELGRELFARLIQVARDEGLRKLTAVTLPENRGMRTIFERLGFTVGFDEDEELVTAEIRLDPPLTASN